MIKYVIVLILVILIIILLRNLQREDFVDNSNFWKGYRLGDIYACWTDPKYEKYKHEYYNSIPEKYPNSIGSEYFLRNKPMKKRNFLLLNKIIEEKSHKLINKPGENDIILHLRIGDAITGYNKNTDKFDYNKHYPTKFENIVKNIGSFKNKRVVIMYGNHLNDINLKPTEIYLQKIRNLFKKNNINFIENNSDNPDKDFLYMTNSKTFIKSGGGFSNLIASIVHYRKNNVYQLD